MYTIKNYSSDSIRCDDSRAYTQRGITKTNYFVTRKSNSIEVKAQIVHKNDRGDNFYKERERSQILYRWSYTR